MSDNMAPPFIRSLEGQRVEKVRAASLSQLVTRTYSTVKARVVIIKCKQKEDELGKRDYIFGICEDAKKAT
jgi:hypothetical protein